MIFKASCFGECLTWSTRVSNGKGDVDSPCGEWPGIIEVQVLAGAPVLYPFTLKLKLITPKITKNKAIAMAVDESWQWATRIDSAAFCLYIQL